MATRKKVCSKCRQKKWLREFHSEIGTRDGKQSYCRECKRTYARARNYNMTSAEFTALNEKQGGRCAICGGGPRGKHKDTLCVDHCHKTQRIRGLLCDTCNRGLGFLGDNIEGLTRALNHVKKGTTQDDDD